MLKKCWDLQGDVSACEWALRTCGGGIAELAAEGQEGPEGLQLCFCGSQEQLCFISLRITLRRSVCIVTLNFIIKGKKMRKISRLQLEPAYTSHVGI